MATQIKPPKIGSLNKLLGMAKKPTKKKLPKFKHAGPSLNKLMGN